PKHWDVEGSNKLDPGTTNDMNGERLKPHTDSLFVEGMQPTGFVREFVVNPQAAVDREMRHMMGTNQRGEREHRWAGTNLAGDRFTYHGFEHRMRKLKMSMFKGEDAYGWIYGVEWYFEIQGIPQQEQLRAAALCMEDEALSWYRWSEGRTPFHLWEEGSARAYIALFKKLACQLVGVPKTVIEATFTKGLKPTLRATVRVMNPEGLNHAMELDVSIEDNQLFDGVMQSKGVIRSGYQQKDRKPSQNDKTEHGMEKTVQNQGQSPKMPKSESILKNTIECNLNPSDGPGKPNSITMKTVKAQS
ncbi:hypothetical protein Tco_1558324, partial [Tanacetum coccineum]